MPDLTTFLKVELPETLQRFEQASGKPLAPGVRQIMLQDMENRFREIYMRHLDENPSEVGALRGAIEEFRATFGSF